MTPYLISVNRYYHREYPMTTKSKMSVSLAFINNSDANKWTGNTT